MKQLRWVVLAAGIFSLLLAATQCTSGQVEQAGKTVSVAKTGSPADHLPPYITRLTYFGQRAD